MARLCIEDDGAGFDTSTVRSAARGLAGMRFRVVSHGGRFDVTSQPGRGTAIEVQLPQQRQSNEMAEAAAADASAAELRADTVIAGTAPAGAAAAHTAAERSTSS
jgi:signal transduction histidine kinase